jgi:hypothetical protein
MLAIAVLYATIQGLSTPYFWHIGGVQGDDFYGRGLQRKVG